MFKHKKIPQRIVAKANGVLNNYHQGNIKARKTKRLGYLSLEVTREYRLLNTGKSWELMSHELYNRKIDK